LSLPRLARIVFAVGLAAIVIWNANPAEVARAAAGTDLGLVALAVLLVLVDRTLNAYRWIELLRALTPGSRPPFATVLRIFFISTFMGTFLPSVGGDVYRAYSLASHDVRPAESAASVLMDRILGVLSMVLLAVSALILMPRFATHGGITVSLGLAAAGCVVAGTVVFSSTAAGVVQAWAARLPGARLRRIASSLTDAVRRYSRHHGELLRVLAASVAVQMLRVFQAYLLGRALGIPLGIGAYLVFIPLIVLVLQVPVTVSGIGTSQWAFDWLFGQAGVPSAQAVALSILFIALGTVGNLPGGILYALGRARRPSPSSS
jgi:glycosyltransferase 2 family protein